MKKKNFFSVDELNNIFSVKLNEIDGLSFVKPSGSYNLLKARLFDLTYPNYLRMARDNYGAQLKGRDGYIIEFFTEKEKANILCEELNLRLNKVLEVRERNIHEYLKSINSSGSTE